METDIPNMEDIFTVMTDLNKDNVAFIAEYLNTTIREDFSFADIGCGTGLLFTIPLFYKLLENKSLKKLIGYDVDMPSIEWGNKTAKCLFNNDMRIEFRTLEYTKGKDVFDLQLMPLQEKYDVVSCNAVLEHTRDPVILLTLLSSIVKPNGIIFISIPNGYGPYEVDSFIYRTFKPFVLPGFFLLRKLKRVFIPPVPPPPPSPREFGILKETFNDVNNHHVFFFTERNFACLLKKVGLRVISKRGCGFLGGPVYNIFFSRIKLIEKINNSLKDKVPFCFANMWCFLIKKSEEDIHETGSS